MNLLSIMEITKKSKLESLVFLLVILTSTVNTSFFGSNPNFTMVTVGGIFLYSPKRSLSLGLRKYFIVVSIYLFFHIIHFIKFSDINPLFMYRTISRLSLGFIALSYFRYGAFRYYVKWLYLFSLISIIFYIAQLINFDFTFFIINSIQKSIPFISNASNETNANIIFWGLQRDIGTEYRNCGFMWEPGAFAAMLLPAIFLAFAISKHKWNFKITVMVIALLTTLSTTGYIGLAVILIWHFLALKKRKILFILGPFAIILFTYLFITLDFLGAKIIDHFETIDIIIDNAYSTNREFASLGRFGSAKMDLIDLQKNLFFGIGGSDEQMTTIKGKFINRTNGLTNYLLRFGVVGFLLFFWFFIKSSQNLSRYFSYSYPYFFIIIILVLSFSNGVLLTPLFLMFQMTFILNSKIELGQDEK